MSSNFDFLQADWQHLRNDAAEVERCAFTAPRTAAFYARRTLERTVLWMYQNDRDLKKPYQNKLGALLHEQTFKDNLPSGLFNKARYIHKLGNLAVHSDKNITQYDGLQAAKSLHSFLGFVVKIYSEIPPDIVSFAEDLIPKPTSKTAADKTAAQLSEIQNKLVYKDAEIEAARAKHADTRAEYEAEIKKLRERIAGFKTANEGKIHDRDYDEEETRDLFIDLMLREAGWDPKGVNVEEYPVVGMPYGSGNGFVDYVLWGDDGLPLAVVEAKRTRKSPKTGQQQAKLYADCLVAMTGRRPLIYYSNGYETWLWDDHIYPPRPVQGFYTKDELQLAINRRDSRKEIASPQVNRQIVNRYYQVEAIRRVMEHYGNDKARKALTVMATGSGKTRTAVAAVEILTKANWVRRVLFLADRNALVRQAKNAFNAHLPHASLTNLVEEKEDDSSRIVFSTYPTMMNCIDDARKDGRKRFGVGYFDLIIIDEAHRSVYQKYGAIFDYFDAMLLGLTATPKADVGRNTYRLFDLENNVPTYAYELEQAVADGFLVPPRPISVPLKFQRTGVRYDELSEEEKEEYEATFRDEETGEIPDHISPGALNKWLFNKDTVDKVLKHLMERGLKVEGGDRLGKTIIFAKNHKHAEFIVERFDKNYPYLKGQFCRVIDNTVNYAQSLIDDFYGANKMPMIAVSVDMMDTGIDVPEAVNLVFFKLVHSKTKFWQMLGRGTRLCPDLFGPEMNKNFFFLFDYCQNLEFFSVNPEGIEGGVQESIKQKVFKRRLDLTAILQDSEGEKGFLKDLLTEMHTVVQTMDTENFIVRPHRQYVEDFSDRQRWNGLSIGDIAEIRDRLTGLPSPDEDDEFARRFDLLIVNLQMAILNNDARQVKYRDQIRDIASAMEEKKNVPSVAAQMSLILELQSDEYWGDVTLPMLETVRRKLRDLVRFIDKSKKQETVYTDFEDEMGVESEYYDLVRMDPSLKNYRLKVEKYIRTNQDHITIHRLRTNQPITGADLKALEDILYSEVEGVGSKENLTSASGDHRPLGVFVRNIVGMDRNAAKTAFADFLTQNNMTADQIRFIDQIVDHLVQNGVMEPELLFKEPFTNTHHEGVAGVFPLRAANVVEIVRQVNGNAVAG
ncbi:DEAD/DEAH box helicase family protein [Thermodesulfobacteriota bacterium]